MRGGVWRVGSTTSAGCDIANRRRDGASRMTDECTCVALGAGRYLSAKRLLSRCPYTKARGC